jgi:catechol 2,3-dioxygenase-like lactoylglutathione lyase family enzyme
MGIPDGGYKVRMVRKGNSMIEIFEFATAESGEADRPVHRAGITHFALASDDFQKDYDDLAEKGVEFLAPPFGQSPQRFAYGRDPFGNVFELLEHAEGDTGLSFAE